MGAIESMQAGMIEPVLIGPEARIRAEAEKASLSLEGVLVFTGGIGENQPVIRQEACDQLAYLGLLIDPLANEQASRVVGKGHPLAIHAADSSAEIWVLATDEGRVAAEQAVGLYSCSLGV
jgi:acetate kinase